MIADEVEEIGVTAVGRRLDVYRGTEEAVDAIVLVVEAVAGGAAVGDEEDEVLLAVVDDRVGGGGSDPGREGRESAIAIRIEPVGIQVRLARGFGWVVVMAFPT